MFSGPIDDSVIPWCDLRLKFFIFSDDRCCDGGGGEEEGGAVRDHEEAGDQRRGEESPPPQHQSVQIGDTPFYGSSSSISSEAKYSFICVFK